jgi:hypothetical protein
MSKRCAEFKVSPTATGKTKRVCARYEDAADAVLVPQSDDQGNLGLVVPEPLSGLGQIAFDDFVGPGVGLIGTGLGAVLAARYGGRLHSVIAEYYGLAGAAFGVLASMALYYVKGKKAMISGVVSSVMLGLGIQFVPKLAAGQLTGCNWSGLGLLTADPVGALPPQVLDAGSAPQAVYHQADVSAWGRVV